MWKTIKRILTDILAIDSSRSHLTGHQPVWSRQREHIMMKQIKDLVDQIPLLSVESQGVCYDLQLRLATWDDLEAIVELELLAYDGFLAWSLNDFRRDWQSNSHAVYLVLENLASQTLVGLASGRFLLSGAHLSHLIIDPSLQGLGLGDYLLANWQDLVRSQSIPQVTLEVRETNYRAQQLYRKHGFIQKGRRPGYYHDNREAALLLACNLRNDRYAS